MNFDLSRFIIAQQRDYRQALAEIKRGRKETHWMWYIFPQLKGLGQSPTSEYYGIQNLEEARAFLENEYLGANLIEISNALLQLDCDDAGMIMDRPDDMKLKSSMTLFYLASPDKTVFKDVLCKYFDGKPDYKTLKRLDRDFIP